MLHIAKHASQDDNEVADTAKSMLDKLGKKFYHCLVCNVKIPDVEMLKKHMDYHIDEEYVSIILFYKKKTLKRCSILYNCKTPF